MFVKSLCFQAIIIAMFAAPALLYGRDEGESTTNSAGSSQSQTVNIASKRAEDVKSAPSMITVITDNDIENMGAENLTDIMRIVPGFDIIKTGSFGAVLMGARGYSDADNKIKVMLDGHSLNMPYDGGSAFFFDDIPLYNVKKIEIIRGPGAALYGEDAFLAVINIITKRAADIDGIEAGAGFGSHDSQEYNAMFGKTVAGVDVTGFARFFNTNGLSDTIKTDALAGQPSSNTPGDTDDGRKNIDLNLSMEYKDIRFVAKYVNKDTEPFVGSNYVLTDDGENRFNYVTGQLSYKWDVDDKLTVEPKVYYDQYDMQFFGEPRPDGFTIQSDIDQDGDLEAFPEGMLADTFATNRRVGGDIKADYKLFDGNSLTVGFDYKWERQTNVDFHANFDPLTNASLDSIEDVSNTNWVREAYRQVWSVYFQDQWDISETLGLTVGLRHDHYSDFEGATNPRVGVVWNFTEAATLKLLYGQAFRAPAFNELYIDSNPVVQGNTSLDPETIRTYEAGVSYEFSEKISANINYFFNVVRDEIGLTPLTADGQTFIFDNIGKSNIQGIELEAKAKLCSKADLFANYTYVDIEPETKSTSSTPRHKGNVGINMNLVKYLDANIHTFISGDRERLNTDVRDESPGYALVNLTLTAKEFFNTLKIRASIFNLFDKEYDDPAPRALPNDDLPRPGRTFHITADYKF